VILLALALYATPHAIDGDTVVIKGEHIRVLQVDTPERGTCYAEQAKQFTQKFLDAKGQLMIGTDTKLDKTDVYGRSLRYVFKGNQNLSLELVRRGYAKPLFFNKMRGKYADLIQSYARQAKANRLGLWKCTTGETKWNKKNN
jgi:endonuclease YncB( thermonuclease family)